MSISLDANLLLGFYQSRLPAGAAGPSTTAGAAKKVAPTAPWSRPAAGAELTAAVKAALAGRKLVDENAAQLDLPGASADYRKLFALYQGLETLSALASRATAKGITSLDKGRVKAAFAAGLAEIVGYARNVGLENLRLTSGEAATLAKSKLTVPKPRTEYVTDPLTTSPTGSVAAFEGDVKFTISVKLLSVTHAVAIDLAGMGAVTRSLANVINYVNQELQSAGVETRLATQRMPGQTRTITAGGQQLALPAGPDQWALKVKVGFGETVSFSAPSTAGAVYLAQEIGDPDPDGKASTNDGVTQRQLLKFQTDTASVPAPPQPAGAANWVEDRLFAQTLAPEVKTIRAQSIGADGAVYVLADVTGKTAGQDIKGGQDVALLKYDSAGKLVYARTLGAAGEATGLGLAVSADGQVAVAGSVRGALLGAVEGALNSGTTGAYANSADSFVTLFDADGEEVWTQRRGARQEDEAGQVAFGADGTVYVAGRAKSVMPGGETIGGWDGYIEAFKADDAGQVRPLFTQIFGTVGADRPAGLAVDGQALVAASVEDGRAVLRRFDISSGAPVLTASRDLGDLQGGDIAGLALDGGEIVLAGFTANGALGGLPATRPLAGGSDAFALRISASLAPAAGDRIAYYGGSGDDRATSLAVAAGQVWIAGAAGTDLPGHEPVGVKDGFLARLDVATGAVDWSRRFTGKDGHATPGAIAVAPQGASVLDRLGLPSGQIAFDGSARITAHSSLRAGDQFTVRALGGAARTVTIDDADTLDTLAQKIRRASGFQAKVSIVTVEGARQLKIEPGNNRALIEFGVGKTDRDALAILGIPDGIVRATRVGSDGKPVPADGKPMLYGLGLPSDLNLASDAEIRHALAEIAAAQGVIRTAYKQLVAAATPRSPLNAAAAAATSGSVPRYLTDQIASYQAALARLTGGG